MSQPFATDESIQQLRNDFSKIHSDTHYADVAIIVGNERLLSHRVILANRSQFFDNILSNLPLDANHMIEIDLNAYNIKAQVESFKIILKYLYNGEIFVNHENCLEIYSLCRQLKLDSAEQVCNQYLERMKHGSQVCGLLRASKERGEEELFQQCMRSFEEKTTECLASDLFLTVPLDVIIQILKSNKISCTERQLFNAIIRWWGSNKDDILPNATKIEQDKYLVDNFLFYIRYPIMEPSDIVEIERMDLLPEEYILQALRFHALPIEVDIKEELGSEEFYKNPDFRLKTRTEAILFFDFDPNKKGPDMVYSNDNTTVEIQKNGVQAYQMALSTKGISNGVVFFEVSIDSCTSSSHIMVGVSNGTQTIKQWLGQDKSGWSWFGYNGTKYHGGTCPVYANATKFAQGDVVGVKLDLRKDGTISFFKNGQFLGVAFTQIGGTKPLYPAISLRTTGDKVTILSGSDMKFESSYAPYKLTFDK